MQPTLFRDKRPKKPRRSRYENALLRYDAETLPDRLERLTYLNTIFPKGLAFGADMETVLVFEEVKMAFVNGELISTILLAQAFIERRLQIYFSSIGQDKIGQRGLKAMTDHARKNNLLPVFLLAKIDEVRKRRNPFTHLKDFGHEYTIDQRIMKSIRENRVKVPFELVLEDAKEAISIMYTICVSKIG